MTLKATLNQQQNVFGQSKNKNHEQNLLIGSIRDFLC